MGFDIVHYNLHKTFSQPHGGGGPGGGPVAVRERIEPYLPAPVVVRDGDAFRLDHDRPKSIGRVRGFAGPFGVFVRSYAFMRAYGPGLREMSEVAVLNANYVLARLRDAYDLPYDRLCMHEFVLSARNLKREHGITALDVAKRLMDYGIHPPTVYFPLVVPEALMIEPTETEPKERLDDFVDAMQAIAREAAESPELLKEAPHGRPVRRLDEVRAAKQPVLRYLFEEHPGAGQLARLPELEAIALRVDRPAEAADAVQVLDLLVDLDAGVAKLGEHRVEVRDGEVHHPLLCRPASSPCPRANGAQTRVERLSGKTDVPVRLHRDAEVLRVPGDERLRIPRPEEHSADPGDALHQRADAS